MESRGAALAFDLCWHCHSTVGGEYFCEQCVKVQPIRGEDYFTALELPHRLEINLADLEQRYHDLSRKFHPDFYRGKSAREQQISLDNSATLNKAYRTLKDPYARVEYFIRLKEQTCREIPSQPPPDLLEEILETREALEELRHLHRTTGDGRKPALRAKLLDERSRLGEKNHAVEGQIRTLMGRWDALGAGEGPCTESQREMLKAFRDLLSHRRYLQTILREIEEETFPQSQESEVKSQE